MTSPGNEGKTRATEPDVEPKTTQSQGGRKRKRESNFKKWQQRQRPQGKAKATAKSSGETFKENYYSRAKKQYLNTAEPSGFPGSVDFRHWNPRSIKTKIDWLVNYSTGGGLSGRPKDEWLSPDFIRKCFHPQQHGKLWDHFRRERKCVAKDVQVRYDKLRNHRSQRGPGPDICKELMVVALFGPPGQWIQSLNFVTSAKPADFVRVDEAAFKGKRREGRLDLFCWCELEEMDVRPESGP